MRRLKEVLENFNDLKLDIISDLEFELNKGSKHDITIKDTNDGLYLYNYGVWYSNSIIVPKYRNKIRQICNRVMGDYDVIINHSILSNKTIRFDIEM